MNNVFETLIIGQEVKNYKMLCEILSEDVKGGKSKKLQVKDWERYFDWEKNGNSFIITDIYNEPIPKEDSRSKGNRNVYSKYIEVLLLNLLSNEKDNDYKLLCSRNWLLMNLGIVNYKYTNQRQRQIVKEKGEFEEQDLNEWFNRAWQKTDQILFSALNNLQRRCLLEYSQEILITELDENNKEYSYLGDRLQKCNYMTEKRNTLNELTRIHSKDKHPKIFDSMRDIYPNYCDEFYEILAQKVLKLFGWTSTFTKYLITYNKENIIEALPTTELQLKRLELNQNIIDAMHVNAQTRSDNALSKFKEEYATLCEAWFGEPPESDCKSFKYIKADNYVEVQDKISEEFIRIDKKSEKLVTLYSYKGKDTL